MSNQREVVRQGFPWIPVIILAAIVIGFGAWGLTAILSPAERRR